MTLSYTKSVTNRCGKELPMKRIKYCLLIIFTICFVLIIPLRFIKRTETSANKPGHEMSIPTVAYGYLISQQIVPNYDYIDSIVLCINSLNCDTSQGSLSIHLLDFDMNAVYENNIPLSELPTYGWFDAIKNVTVSSGDTYYLTVETIDCIDDGPAISYFRSNTAAAAEEENHQLTYAYLPLDDCVLKLRIIYDEPLSRPEYIVYYIFILFIASFLYTNIVKKHE
jgi:hypothetical protein